MPDDDEETADRLVRDRVLFGMRRPGQYPPPHGGRVLGSAALARAGQVGWRAALEELVRARLARRRVAAAPPAEPPDPIDLSALGPVSQEVLRRELDRLALNVELRRLRTPSTRPLARGLIPARAVLHRILAPTLDAQQHFNDAGRATIERLVAVIAAQQARIAELEARMDDR